MRWIVKILFPIIAISACGPKTKLPEGAPPFLKKAELLENVNKAELKFKTLRLSGKGVFNSDKERQSFRFDIRMLNDSLIWINISDPLLGIGIARGLITPGEVSYYNSLDKSFYRGSPLGLQQQLGFNFAFQNLFPLLSANAPGFEQSTISHVPGSYVIMNFDPSGKTPPSPQQEAFTEVYISPDSFRPLKIEIKEPVNSRSYAAEYGDYVNTAEVMFPEKIALIYQAESSATIELDINRIEPNGAFGFPYSIPASYEQVR